MALTRPRAYQIETSIESIIDPITVLHAGSTMANVDVGFLVNRANGLLSNVAIYWSETSGSFVTAYTTSSGGADSNIAVTSYAPITVGNLITTNGVFWANGSPYSSGSGGGGSFNGGAVTGATSFTNTTTSTSNSTGAVTVSGGVGISGAVNIGTSLTVDNGSYGNVTTTQFGSVFATAYGPNNYSIIQAWAPVTSGGLGFNAYGNIVYSAGAINFKTGATIRDKDYPTGGTNGVQIAANGAIIASTGIASTTTTTGALIVAGGAGISGNVYAGNIISTQYGNIVGTTNGNIYTTGSIIPTSNITYDLGTTTQRFRSLYLSGNTIDLGGASIKTDATTGAIAFVPQPTAANPNPTGIVVSPSGTISTVSTTGGVLASNAISTSSNASTTSGSTFSNANVTATLTVGNLITTSGLFWANGTSALTSSYGNTQVAAYLPTYTGNIAGHGVAGNLTVYGNISVTNAISTTSLIETSSITLKENVRPIEDPFEILLQLVGVVYDRKDGSSFDEPGLIAEAVALISSALVSKNADGTIEGVKYTRIIAYLIEAVKYFKQSETQNNKIISNLIQSVEELKTEIRLLQGGNDGNL